MNYTARLDTPEHARIRFLDNEIDLSQTFLDLAELEKGHIEPALKATLRAHQGYATALGCVNSVRDARDWDRLMARIFSLKERLDHLD